MTGPGPGPTAPVDPMLDPANRLKLRDQQNGPNALQNAIQNRNSAYNSTNPYATPDNLNYWKAQDQVRQQAVGQLPATPVTPAASALNNQTDTSGMLSTINQYGKTALQGVQGSVQTQQVAAADRQNRAWQKQQEDAYARLSASYNQQISDLRSSSTTATNPGSYSTTGQMQTLTADKGQGTYNATLDNQIADWARQAGWSETNIPMVVAIAHAESGGNPGAVNDQNSNGSTDRGLMQINSVHADLLNTGDVMNPVDNLKMALQVYNDAGNWTPWSTFNNNAYQNFLTTPTFGATYLTNVGNQVNTTSTGLRMNLVNTAMKYLGTPYVWGGNSLTQGVDCSGLVQQLYGQFGISMPRTAAQDATLGSKTNIANLQPGDLIGWQGGGHIAIYAGNGEIIESPDVGLTVRRRALRSNEHDVSQGGTLIGIHLSLTGD